MTTEYSETNQHYRHGQRRRTTTAAATSPNVSSGARNERRTMPTPRATTTATTATATATGIPTSVSSSDIFHAAVFFIIVNMLSLVYISYKLVLVTDNDLPSWAVPFDLPTKTASGVVDDIDIRETTADTVSIIPKQHPRHDRHRHQQQQRQSTNQNDANWILRHWSEHLQEMHQYYHEHYKQNGDLWYPQQPITAYLEPPLNATIPNTGRFTSTSSNNEKNAADKGIPPVYYHPLPLRVDATPGNLQKVLYPNVQTCFDMPAKLPVDGGISSDRDHVWNVGTRQKQQQQQQNDSKENEQQRRQQQQQRLIQDQLPNCPVDADPYLPWIHDIVLVLDEHNNEQSDHEDEIKKRRKKTKTKKRIQFIAQNKRRCNTGSGYEDDLERLEPQIALMQSVSVQTISEQYARQLAPELWTSTSSSNNIFNDNGNSTIRPRYRLYPYYDYDNDGGNYKTDNKNNTVDPNSITPMTRFICQFYTLRPLDQRHDGAEGEEYDTFQRIDLGQTLSEFPFNYDWISYRKSPINPSLLSRHGKDNGKFWASTLMFSCPLPEALNEDQSSATSSSSWVLPNGQPLLYVNIIPIRTPPRYIWPITTGTTTTTMTTTTRTARGNGHDGESVAEDEKMIGHGFYFPPSWLPPEAGHIHRRGNQKVKRKGYNSKKKNLDNEFMDGGVHWFDPYAAWGSNGHVLPEIQASGRWENLPICPIVSKTSTTKTSETMMTDTGMDSKGFKNEAINAKTITRRKRDSQKPYYLSACVWASSTFRTRGENQGVRTDTQQRLIEWLEFHLTLAGFDHIYLYDNSGSMTMSNPDTGNHTDHSSTSDADTTTSPISLRELAHGVFPSSQVTFIDWPFVVCNNNIPAHDNTGERSSQYAAENSCRTRYASQTEWIAVLDLDEYLVPMGNYTSLVQVLQDLPNDEYYNDDDKEEIENDVNALSMSDVPKRNGVNILSFRSTRGKLRHSASEQFKVGRIKLSNVTYLEAYNCDEVQAPRPEFADRARKQIYRSDYVLNHFVHYSTVTRGYLTTYNYQQQQQQQQQFINTGNRNDDVQRETTTPNDNAFERYFTEATEIVVDEIHQATLVHTKELDFGGTKAWKKRCVPEYNKRWTGCRIGFPWPRIELSEQERQQQQQQQDQKINVEHAASVDLSHFQIDNTTTINEDGYTYNCFVNPKVEDYWIPKLNEALVERKKLQKQPFQ